MSGASVEFWNIHWRCTYRWPGTGIAQLAEAAEEAGLTWSKPELARQRLDGLIGWSAALFGSFVAGRDAHSWPEYEIDMAELAVERRGGTESWAARARVTLRECEGDREVLRERMRFGIYALGQLLHQLMPKVDIEDSALRVTKASRDARNSH